MTLTRRWIKRAAFVVGGYLVVVIGAHLSTTQVNLALLAAIVLAGCALWWCGADSLAAASEIRWEEPEQPELRYARTDPAASYLHRLCADVTTTSTRHASPTAARSLQTTVAALVDQRVEQRPLRGLPTLQELPTELTDYLRADPAPRLRPEQLDRIVTSIEEL
ncbi:hypothetical protein V3G39_07425 [Dermatophilaceae bacterium Sec6.4]